jgi:hypothetical protein
MFDRNSNSHSKSGKFFTVVSDQREFDAGLIAWSFFYSDKAIENLEDDVTINLPSFIVMTSTYYQGDDVTGINLGSA